MWILYIIYNLRFFCGCIILFFFNLKSIIPGHRCVCKRNCRTRSISHKTSHADSVVYRSRRRHICMYRVHYKSPQFGYQVCSRPSRSNRQHRSRFPRTHIAYRKNRDYRNTRRTLICRYSYIPQRSIDIPISRFVKRLVLCKFD